MNNTLDVVELTKSFGGIRALKGISFGVKQESIVGLIGPNGSGKTVTIDCITGYLRPDGGKVILGGKDITGSKPHEVAAKGVARTFQLARLYPKMTVFQLLSFASQGKSISENFRVFTRSLVGREQRTSKEGIKEVLTKAGLSHLSNEKIINLSYGHQKIVGFLSLTLMIPEPTIYLLDEPMSGLNVSEIKDMMKLIKDIQLTGKTFLIIEHNLKVVMGLCEHIIVLDEGEKIFEGTPQETLVSSKVVEAYVGRVRVT